MGALELKNKIAAYLELADERVLKIVNSVFENYYDNEQVAFHPDGEPMSKKEYKNLLEKAEENIKTGDYISAEEFEQQID